MSATIIRKTDSKCLSTTIALLAKGGVAILPCDTIYGLVGMVPSAQESLRFLKGRQETKPFLQLATLDMVKKRVQGTIDASILASWPGPLSVVLTELDGTATAFRVPADPFMTAVLTSLGSPIYSTSVNFSGQESLSSFPEIVSTFASQVELIVEGDTSQGTVASTLIDATVKPYRLLREGAFDARALIAGSSL